MARIRKPVGERRRLAPGMSRALAPTPTPANGKKSQKNRGHGEHASRLHKSTIFTTPKTTAARVLLRPLPQRLGHTLSRTGVAAARAGI